jgi:signal transduction histidine kinase
MTTTNPNNGSIFSEAIKPTPTNGHKPLPAYQSQKMEQLGYLASSIAHDFNNLLTSIMGHASLALIKMTPEDDARLHVEQAVKTAEYAAILTAQLLSYSHYEYPEKEFVDLNKLVNDTIGLLGSVLFHNIHIALKLSPNLAPIEANPAQIQQVIMNLTINATEAIHEPDGSISIETGQIIITKSRALALVESNMLLPGEYVFLRIADTGKGIDEVTKAHIFEPFFSTKSHGRGLGLSAIRDIVKQHNGGIEIESCVGQGSVFTVYLPASRTSTIHQPIH